MFFDKERDVNSTVGYVLECAFENIGKMVRVLDRLEDVEGDKFDRLSVLVEHQLAMTRVCYLPDLLDIYSKSFDKKYEESELKKLSEELEELKEIKELEDLTRK